MGCDDHDHHIAIISDSLSRQSLTSSHHQSKQQQTPDQTELVFYPTLTFSFLLFPKIHGNVSTMQQHKREYDTMISCGEAALSQLPATFKPGKSLRV